jgi:LysM repeat protein
MAQVHTEYGPGRIIDQETVRGRTRYKVAGEGFEVWLDQTKLGGYEAPVGGPDFDAPHWEGHNLDDGVVYPDVHIPSEEEYGDEYGMPGRFDRERLREHHDESGYGSYGGDDPAHYSKRQAGWHPSDIYDFDERGPEDIYSDHEPEDMRGLEHRLRIHEHDMDDPAHYSRRLVGGYDESSDEDDPYAEHDDDEHFTNLRDRFRGFDDDDPAKYSRRQASGYDESFDDDPYAEHEGEDDGRFINLRDRFDGYDDDDPAKYSTKRVVRGKGSSSRTAWAPLDRDNSTDLPYNPDPQHEAIGTYGDDDSSTIQPIHHIDADERLRSSDSITFEDEDEDDGPGPNPELFAREAGFDKQANPGIAIQVLRSQYPNLYKKVRDKGENLVDKVLPGHGKTVVRGGEGAVDAATALGVIGGGAYALNRAVDYATPGPGWGGLIKGSARHEASPAAVALPLLRVLGPMALQGLMGGHDEGEGGDVTAPGDWNGLVKEQSLRPAGLSDRYIDLTASVDYYNDPAAQFRHDPDAYINRVGQVMDEGLNPRFAEYMELVEGDRSIRTAAWKDVRKKAMRLKTSGAVHVKDIAPNRIMASVDGDHGTYDVVILKGASFGGFSGGQSISNWHCACEWGRWAFRRKYTYVGRLCSHAYASYLTMQSSHMTNQPRQTKLPKRKAPSRALPNPFVKRSDALQNGPQRITPDMVVNDTDDAHMFVDVTKDERDDTGPDDVVSEKDIVHFARIMAECERTEQPYPRRLVAFLSRYSGCADDSGDDVQADYEAHDADDANEYLNEIRDFGDRDQSEDFGSMAERVHKIQDAVEEARAHGADASQFVARRKIAAPDTPFQDDVEGLYRNVITDPANGLGGRVRSVGETVNNYFTGEPKGDPESNPYVSPLDIGDNDGPNSETKTRAGEQTSGLPISPSGQGGGAYAQSDRRGVPRPGTTGDPALSQVKGPGKSGETSDAAGSGAGNAGGNGGKAPAGGTKGPVSDGGVAGAENGNNEAIKGNEYTVQAGDTLTDIAQRAYGDMNRYEDIAKANGISDVDNLEVGKTYKLDNAQGNNGVSGDVTNPTGGGADKNPATQDFQIGITSPSGNTLSTAQGFAGGAPGMAPAADAAVPTPPTPKEPAVTPAVTPASGEKSSMRRRAAEGEAGATNETAPTTDQPSADAANPGANRSVSAENPATPEETPAKPGDPAASDVYDPNDPAQVQTQNSSMANPMSGVGTGGTSGMGDMGNLLGQGVGAASSFASGLGNAIGGGGLGAGIGGLASGIGSAIGGIFSSKQDADDWRRYAYPAGGGDDFDPETLPHIPFAGSGNPGPVDFGTSEEYADMARAKMDDVTDLGDDPLSTPMGDWQKQGSYDEATDDGSDIVRSFQANLGDTALGSDAGGGGGRYDDFASAAQGFLRTAGRNYSLAEQSELIREGDKGGAGNLRSLDLAGTHYEDMDSLGW